MILLMIGCWFYYILTVVRALLASYYVQQTKRTASIDLSDFTAIQPILSGDPALEKTLRANVLNHAQLSFLWLIDKDDQLAQQVAENIIQQEHAGARIKVMLFDRVPERLNPKVYKIKLALPHVMTTYSIVLDDDVVVDVDYMAAIEPYLKRDDEWLITGIPYNSATNTFWSKLVATFVNSQSFFAYFSLAQLNATDTINGMFYIAPTQLFKKYNVFKEIEEWLCDDLALARYLRAKQVALIQLPLFCDVQTTVTSYGQYVRLMKRWLLFASIYFKQVKTVVPYLFVLLPALFPMLLVVSGLALGQWWIVGILIGKACFSYAMRYIMFARLESILIILYEVVSDLCLPVLFVYTLLTGPTIRWRNKTIKVMDGRITYEEV